MVIYISIPLLSRIIALLTPHCKNDGPPKKNLKLYDSKTLLKQLLYKFKLSIFLNKYYYVADLDSGINTKKSNLAI